MKMSRRILSMMLMLVTLFVVGKIGLNLVNQEGIHSILNVVSVEGVTSAAWLGEDEAITALDDVPNQLAVPEESQWGELWIPKAEAAASMPLAEESQGGHEDLKALQTAREQIAIKEKALNEQMDALNKADERVKKRILELEALQASIQDFLEQEKAIKNKKIKRLTAVYEGMKPEKAAAVISKMELVTVVKMFSKMNEKQVGKILSFLKPDQAMKISQALTKGIALLQKK